MKLLFPDACWTPRMVSGALFLYFHDDSVGFTTHPSVSTFMTGVSPFGFMQLVEERKPAWLPQFSAFIDAWKIYRSSYHETSKLLEPLHGAGFTGVWLVYDRGSVAWESAKDLLSSVQLEGPEITKVVDPMSASDELFAHIFLEKYLELYKDGMPPDQVVQLVSQTARADSVELRTDVDWRALYEYCDELFGSTDLKTLLNTAYMFRLPALGDTHSVLLSNPRLVDFLASLPVEREPQSEDHADQEYDIVAWEFFRQIVSPHIDPLNEASVGRIMELRAQRVDEIEALKRRCLSLALDLRQVDNLDLLQRKVSLHVRGKVESDVQALLSLDKAASNEFLGRVFSDEKTWMAIAALLYSLAHAGPIITAGAAIVTLSSIGSKAVGAAAHRRETLRASDYALLYRMKQ